MLPFFERVFLVGGHGIYLEGRRWLMYVNVAHQQNELAIIQHAKEIQKDMYVFLFSRFLIREIDPITCRLGV